MPAMTALTPVKSSKAVENSMSYGTALVTFLINGEDTGGDFSLLEMNARPGSEPPYHIHEREDETFYILEGRVSVMVDGEIHELGAGETMFLPRGIPHTFRIRSASARALLVLTPSGFEGYFRAMGQPAETLEIPEPAELPADFMERVARETAVRGVRLASTQPEF